MKAGGPSPAVALATAMSAMKGKVAPAAFQHAAQTLLAYVRNLVAHPDDPKYRRIKVCISHQSSPPGHLPMRATWLPTPTTQLPPHHGPFLQWCKIIRGAVLQGEFAVFACVFPCTGEPPSHGG